jgi:hypothetical protein
MLDDGVMERTRSSWGIYAAVLLFAVGCGGNTDAAVEPDPTGRTGLRVGLFDHGPVEGLSYATPTLSGMTNAAGEFLYEEGEEVTFSIGDITLGTALAQEVITPFDLAGIEPPTEALDVRRAINSVNWLGDSAPFDTALNIALLLQTVDDDGDDLTGIQIPEQLHATAVGFDVDFEQDWNRFNIDPAFNGLIDSARRQGLWGGSRSKRPFAVVANTLYDALGLVAAIAAPVEQSKDRGNGTTVYDRKYFAYDPDGRRVVYSFDEDGDGSGGISRRITRAYDADGGTAVTEVDGDGDGPGGITERVTRTFDVTGRLLVVETDGDGDGPGGITQRSFKRYDDDGYPIAIEMDLDGDGPDGIGARLLFRLDEAGRIVSYEYDANADNPGGIVYREIYRYDEHGRQTITEYDLDGDGPAGLMWRHTVIYDDNGNQTAREFDSDGDGPLGISDRDLYSYDDDGNLTALEYDSDGDGPNGNLTRYRFTLAPIDRWGAAFAQRRVF